MYEFEIVLTASNYDDHHGLHYHHHHNHQYNRVLPLTMLRSSLLACYFSESVPHLLRLTGTEERPLQGGHLHRTTQCRKMVTHILL